MAPSMFFVALLASTAAFAVATTNSTSSSSSVHASPRPSPAQHQYPANSSTPAPSPPIVNSTFGQADQNHTTWAFAPACVTYKKINLERDTYGNPWAWDTSKNRSCAVKDTSQPLLTDFQAAPRCSGVPTLKNSKPDTYGNLWGYEHNVSCAFRDSDDKPLALIIPRAVTRKLLSSLATATASATASAVATSNSHGSPASAVANSHASAASDGTSNAHSDANSVAAATNGTAISNTVSAANATDHSNANAHGSSTSVATHGGLAVADTPATAIASNGSNVTVIQTHTAADSPVYGAQAASAGVSWASAPACSASPNQNNSVPDANGRLWGYESWHSCAFKNATSQAAIFYSGYVAPFKNGNTTKVSWSAAPNCSHLLDDVNYDVDGCGRKWGWQNATSCKFVDSHGSAIYVTMVGTSQPSAASAAAANTSAPASPASQSDSMQDLMRAIAVLLQNYNAAHPTGVPDQGADKGATPAADPSPSAAIDATSQADASSTAGAAANAVASADAKSEAGDSASSIASAEADAQASSS